MRPLRVLIFTALILWIGFIAPASAFAQDSKPLSLDEYWTLVHDSQQLLSRLDSGEAASVRDALDSLAARWDSAQSVQLADGQVIALDNRYLLNSLRAESADPQKLSELFKALLDAHAQYPSGVYDASHLDPLRRILTRPEFQWRESTQSSQTNPFQELWDRFARWLDSILGDGDGVMVISLNWLPFLSIVLLVAVLAFVFRNLFAGIVAESQLNVDDNSDELLTSEAAFSRAQNLSRGGDYRSAVRYLYLSSLLLLDERGMLRYDRTRTNREYLRSVAQDAALAEPLKEVVDVFDNVWYGYHELDEESFRHYSGRVEELKEKKE